MSVVDDKILSVIIPCYNEEKSIVELVNRVLKSPIKNKEIIIIEDCSTDKTREVLEKKIRPLVSRIIYHEKNSGKGAALKTGFKFATGDAIIVQDADLEYDPMEFSKVVYPVLKGEEKVVYGSRFLHQKRKGYFTNRIANWILTAVSNLFTKQKITDMETCYKCFRRDVIQAVNLVENRFGFEPEVTAKISKMGIKIKDVPISYHPRTNKEGKKIGFKDGFRALYVIWKYRK